MTTSISSKGVYSAVAVAALGYFVDIYDLILFGVVRISSLNSLGLTGEELTIKGEMLINIQMIGMLIGGILWGIMGDRRGRLSVLFGSIIMYSVANIANGFVDSITGYAIWRFIAGIGLAGELGAGITLVSESMSKENRGYGTTIVASFGLLGAIAAGFVGKMNWNIHIGDELFDNWRVAYIVGGVLGLALLVLRIGVYESGMYDSLKGHQVKRGDLSQLFTNKNNFIKYLNCILIGLPLWFVIGVLVIQSPEFAKALGIPLPQDPKTIAPNAIMLAYIGLSMGDLASGLISQVLKSRKKAVGIFLGLTALSAFIYLNSFNTSLFFFYALCFSMGFSVGYWAMFVTIGSEQFGTNLRATVTTTVPNFVRGSLFPLTLLYQFLRENIFTGTNANLLAANTVMLFCMIIAFTALYYLEETFGKDLNYVE
jgi:MFS family permease